VSEEGWLERAPRAFRAISLQSASRSVPLRARQRRQQEAGSWMSKVGLPFSMLLGHTPDAQSFLPPDLELVTPAIKRRAGRSPRDLGFLQETERLGGS